MVNWRLWVWPCILSTGVLTGAAMGFQASRIQDDLTAKAVDTLSARYSWARVEVDGRDLMLTGIAPGPEEAVAAVEIAKDTYDVRLVENQTTLAPLASPYSFTAVKSEDDIELSGHYPSEEIRSQMVSVLQTAHPGMTVIDNLALARGAPENYMEIVAFGAVQLGGLAQGEVRISNREYSVSGAAPDAQAYERAIVSLNNEMPETAILALVDITAPPVSPYVWTLEKSEDNSIALDGYVPSAAARVDLQKQLAASYPDVPISNTLKIATGQPDNFSQITTYALGLLSDLSSGRMRLKDRNLTIEGMALSGDSDLVLIDSAPDNLIVARDITLPPASGPYSLTAVRNRQGIVLTGYAPGTKAKVAIGDAAEQMGLPVDNRLQLASGAPQDFDWQAAGEAAVAGLSDLAEGTAKIDGITASLEGVLSTAGFDARRVTEFADSFPDGVNIGRVDLVLPVVDPYVWEARHGDRLTLTGYVPSVERAQNIADFAVDLFGINLVENQQKTARGAPEGFAGVTEKALLMVNRLQAGRAVLQGSTLTVSGEAVTAAAKRDIERQLAEELPAGLEGVSDIVMRPPPSEMVEGSLLPADECQVEIDLTLAWGIKFAPGEADILEASYGVMDSLAYNMQQCPDTAVEIIGHTDRDGEAGENKLLSERRAAAVADFLIKSGVAEQRLTTTGTGEANPLAADGTLEGKAQNRRIEITITQE